MEVGCVLVTLDAHVYRCPDAGPVKRTNLLAQEVKPGRQARMAFRACGSEVEKAVMAFGEDRYAVDMRIGKVRAN